MKIIDITGMKFNELTVVERFYRENSKRTLWLCKCDCGNETVVEGYALRNGDIKSCGCHKREIFAKINLTHGRAHTPIYNVWCSMKARCLNPKNYAYKNYGGRGIKVCSEWIKNFENFYNWAIKFGYKKGLSIERIDVNGNYEPSNCKWITMLEQQNNRRNNRKIIYNNREYTVSQLATKLEKNYDYIYARYFRDYKAEREKMKKRKAK